MKKFKNIKYKVVDVQKFVIRFVIPASVIATLSLTIIGLYLYINL